MLAAPAVPPTAALAHAHPAAPLLSNGKTSRGPSRRSAGDAWAVLGRCLGGARLLLLLLASLRAAGRGNLVAENLLLRHQLAVLTRPTRRRRRVRFGRLDKLLWVLVRRLRRDWRRHLVVIAPDIVVRWHRAGWRLYWHRRSCSPGGPPRLLPEVRNLVARVSRENPL